MSATRTEIRLACRVDSAGLRSGTPLTLVQCNGEDESNPGGYILRLGTGVGRRLRSFPSAIRTYELRCHKLGYTTIRTAAGAVLQEALV